MRYIFLPSFGTDSTLYQGFQSYQYRKSNCYFIEWLEIEKGWSLADYARELIRVHNITSEDVLVGTSLGGVIAIEIQKIQPVHRIFIISSLRSSAEHPRLFKIMYSFRLHYLFYPRLLKFGLDLIMPLYGKNIKKYLWFRKVFKGSPDRLLKWGLIRIVEWKNEELFENVIQIHGSRDPLFPIKNAADPQHVITNGAHTMVRFRALEIENIIFSAEK